MLKYASFAAALSLAAAAAPAQAVEYVTDFQLYVLGDLDLNGQNIAHRAAVGGNASFKSTSISGADASHPASLVVGGNLSYKNGGSIAGQALVGGANGAFSYMPVTAGVASLPVDFSIENLRLKNLSATLAQQTANSTAILQYGGLYLTGLNSGLNVFTIDSKTLSKASWLNVNITPGSQVLINVTGDMINLGGGFDFGQSSNVLWNFADATKITAGGISLGGSLLAPNATFQGNSGTIAGNLVVGNFKGAMSFGNAGYAGNLLAPPPPQLPGPVTAVPEPGVWGLMIAGFGGIGAMLRRRRAAGLAAAN